MAGWMQLPKAKSRRILNSGVDGLSNPDTALVNVRLENVSQDHYSFCRSCRGIRRLLHPLKIGRQHLSGLGAHACRQSFRGPFLEIEFLQCARNQVLTSATHSFPEDICRVGLDLSRRSTPMARSSIPHLEVEE